MGRQPGPFNFSRCQAWRIGGRHDRRFRAEFGRFAYTPNDRSTLRLALRSVLNPWRRFPCGFGRCPRRGQRLELSATGFRCPNAPATIPASRRRWLVSVARWKWHRRLCRFGPPFARSCDPAGGHELRRANPHARPIASKLAVADVLADRALCSKSRPYRG